MSVTNNTFAFAFLAIFIFAISYFCKLISAGEPAPSIITKSKSFCKVFKDFEANFIPSEFTNFS